MGEKSLSVVFCACAEVKSWHVMVCEPEGKSVPKL